MSFIHLNRQFSSFIYFQWWRETNALHFIDSRTIIAYISEAKTIYVIERHTTNYNECVKRKKNGITLVCKSDWRWLFNKYNYNFVNRYYIFHSATIIKTRAIDAALLMVRLLNWMTCVTGIFSFIWISFCNS